MFWDVYYPSCLINGESWAGVENKLEEPVLLYPTLSEGKTDYRFLDAG